MTDLRLASPNCPGLRGAQDGHHRRRGRPGGKDVARESPTGAAGAGINDTFH